MEPERWKQVEELCHAALEREESERAAFLKGACAGDEALRQQVETLLAYEKQAEKFMEAPALDAAAKLLAQDQASRPSSETDSGLIGRTVSHYHILQKLGGRGMGVLSLVKLRAFPSTLLRDAEQSRGGKTGEQRLSVCELISRKTNT